MGCGLAFRHLVAVITRVPGDDGGIVGLIRSVWAHLSLCSKVREIIQVIDWGTVWASGSLGQPMDGSGALIPNVNVSS